MPGNAFILLRTQKGVATGGESMQSTHPASAGWLAITDWSWDIESETNFLKGTGASVGVATPGTLNFSHNFDKSSPVIMQNIVLGTSFKSAVIHMLKSTGDASGKPQVYFAMLMTDVFITKVSSKAGEDGAITQDIECVFKTISIGYKQQLNNKGGALAPAITPFGWNIAAKSTSTGILAVTLDPSKDISIP